jgi:beta-galactosidase
MPTRWAFDYHPPLQDPAARADKQGPPDRAAYERIVYRFYGGLERAGHQIRIMHAADFELLDPAALAQQLPTLVVPGLYLASDRLVAGLLAYAEAGGHLVLGIRTAYADEIGRPKLDRQPAGLAAAAGAWYAEFSNLNKPVPVEGRLSGTAEGLVEGLVADGADVLARYEHPHFGRWPAITSKAHGAGRVTYVGTLPGLDLAEALGKWLAPNHPWADALVPGAVAVHGAANAAGERLWFVHNFTWERRSIAPPIPVADLFTGAPVPALELGPWDVRIVREVAT